MISHLNGTVLRDGVIDVGGVGWAVRYPEALAIGTKVSLYITSLWGRDSGPVFYGFSSTADQSVFKALCKVDKVGAAAAMSLLRTHGSTGIANLVARRDAKGLALAPGVGVGTAEKIVALCVLPDGLVGEVRVVDPLEEALASLGYSEDVYQMALARAREESAEGEPEGELLKRAIAYARNA